MKIAEPIWEICHVTDCLATQLKAVQLDTVNHCLWKARIPLQAPSGAVNIGRCGAVAGFRVLLGSSRLGKQSAAYKYVPVGNYI